MKKQILIIILLLLNSLIIFIPVSSGEGEGIFLVDDFGDYERAGFDLNDISFIPHIYTNEGLTSFYMPIALKKEDVQNLKEKDVEHTIYHGNQNFSDRFTSIEFDIYESDTYWLVMYYMIVKASDRPFSIDFVPKIKGEELYQFAWWNSSWDYYQVITRDAAVIGQSNPNNITNFPMLVNISASVTSFCNTNGSDVRFINDTGVEMYYHFAETWDANSYNFVWVNISRVDALKDTVFYMYYGNAGASDNQNANQTWADDMYAGVYYLNETSGATCIDYSGYDNHGTYHGSLPTAGTDIRIGDCQYFDGTDDYISLPSECNDAIDADGGTVITQFLQESPDHPAMIMEALNADAEWWRLEKQLATWWTLSTSAGFIAGPQRGVADGSWQMFGGSIDAVDCWVGGGGNDLRGFSSYETGLDFRTGVTTDITAFDGVFSTFHIGADNAGNTELTGWMDTVIVMYDKVAYEYEAYDWYHSLNETIGYLTWSDSLPVVLTNATTNITETTASFNAYISDEDNVTTGNYGCGFWYGSSFPLEEGAYETNVSVGTYAKNDTFNYNVSSLVPGITYYVKSWISNATYFYSGSHDSFVTIPIAPTDLTLTLDADNNGVDVAWTHTGMSVVVRKNDSYPTDYNDGTVVYNDTGNSYDDDGIGGTYWYYSVWGYANLFSNGSADANISVPPAPPANVTTNVLINNTFNIVWDKGDGANTTVVRRKLDSYPSSVTDGAEMYNDTGTQVNIQEILNYYYSLWSYANYTYSSSVNITVGGLVLSCYDEETNESLWFDVSISNQDGSQSYESYNNTNPHILNISQLPVGDDIKITFNAASNYSSKSESSNWGLDENQTITYVVLSQIPDSKSSTNVTCIDVPNSGYSYPPFTLDIDLVTILPDNADNFTRIFVNYTHMEYSSRLYYRDITESSFGFLNAYLPPTEDKQLYLLEVIDEASNTVEDAHIEVKRSVNGTYVIISRLLTDANGQADINLISNRNYIFIISKDGYITENASWTPGTSIFTHTFKLLWETTPFEPDTFGDIINFYGTLYENNTMRVTYYDLDVATLNTHFIIYENYNDTLTYMGEYNGTTSNDIIFWINVDNATRLHIIVLYMNHSTLGEVINYRIVVYPVHVDREGGDWLENLITGVVGDFTYGYVISFIWYLPCVLLIAGMAAIKHPGVGILGAGLYSIWITWYLNVPGEAKILAFASIAIMTGFITFFLVQGKKVVH